MSTAVYEAVAYAMRYWFIAIAVGILIAMIVASYKEYKEKKIVKTELSQFLGYLEIIRGPEEFEGDRFGIRDNNTIGRAQSCDIVLPDETVALTHAYLFTDEHNRDFYLEPATREKTTKINGRLAIRKHKIKTGDVISIGDVDFAIYFRRQRLHEN